MALITATTAASVTGTVAWFTATRTATVVADSFVTSKVDSTLNVTVTADSNSGTAAVTGNNAAVSIPGKLTHGSYNAQANNAGHLYVADVNGETSPATVTGYSDFGTLSNAQTNGTAPTEAAYSKWNASVDTKNAVSDNHVWYAVAWSMEFTITNSSSLAENSALFFDPTFTTFTDAATTDGTKTIQGLRIALMTTSKYVVVGGLATNGTEKEQHVVFAWDSTTETKATSASDHVGHFNTTGDNAETHYYKYGDALAKAIDSTSTTLEAHNGYLGAFSTSTKKITVTAVAWFEGEDSSIVKDNVMSQVSVSLSFYSRKIKTAASNN